MMRANEYQTWREKSSGDLYRAHKFFGCEWFLWAENSIKINEGRYTQWPNMSFPVGHKREQDFEEVESTSQKPGAVI